MSKKQLKKRIKELEFENEMLRAMRPYPVYYQVYSGNAAHELLGTWISGDSKTHEPPITTEDNTAWWTAPYKLGSSSIGSNPDAKYQVWY